MKFLSITLLVFFSGLASPLAQRNCFETCAADLKKSNIPYPGNTLNIMRHLIGCQAPDFSVTSIKGYTLELSQLRGKVVVLNFWFIGCGPCIAELPGLNRLVSDFKDEEVAFIGFALDNAEAVKKFLNRKDFDYEIVSCEKDFPNKYCILGGYPTNMVLDKEGIVREVLLGGPLDEKGAMAIHKKMKPVIEKYLME